MKKLTLLLALSGFTVCFAQDDLQEKIQRLTTPTSPAAAITGIQPTVVLSPKSYSALETALYNNFTDGQSAIIPKDLGIEFSPFWAKKQRISLDDYLFPSPGKSFLMNGSFSIASSQNFLLGDSTTSNALGFGTRTSIYFPSKADKNRVQNYRDSLDIINNVEIDLNHAVTVLLSNPEIKTTSMLVDRLKPTIINLLLELGYASTQSEAEKIATAFCDDSSDLPTISDPTLANQIIGLFRKHTTGDQVYKHFKNYLKNREGFSIDLAAASLLNFPTNDFEFSYAPKNALWITPTYRFWADDKHVIKAMLVYRYEWYNIDYYKSYFPTSSVYRNNNDFGASVSVEFDKCSFQLECVGRSSNTEIPAGVDANNNELYTKKKSDDLQYMLVVNYRLTDQAILTFNFGNRFDPIANPENTLVSTLSINFGFGAPTKSNIDLFSGRKKPSN